MRSTIARAAAGLLFILTTACAGAQAAAPTPDDATTDGGAVGMCAPGVTDCVDVVVLPEDAAAAARELLGMPEAELPEDVRVGRRGDEHLMLTEDHVVGRHTVELDDDGAGTYVVTAVTVELEEGIEVVR